MRIVSLLPSVTEILFAIGAGSDVVGVTHECDYPPAARTLPQLTTSILAGISSSAAIDRHVRTSVHAGSSLYGLDGDALERLEPDLIVTQELCAVCAVSYEIVDRAAKRLHHDARIVSLEPASLDDVFANILYLGTLTGRETGARQVVTALQARVTALRERTSQAVGPRPRVLLLEWTDPPMGGGHWTPGLVELAGGDCILGNPGGNAPTLSWDAIAAAEPQAIVVVPCGYDVDRSREAARELETNTAYTSLPAYRKGRILAMDGNVYVSRPGPRLVDSAEIIADFLERTDREQRQDFYDDDDCPEHIAGEPAAEPSARPPADQQR